MENTIRIKPLSVNEAWKGRRYRTDKYKSYVRELHYMLKPFNVSKEKLKLDIVFGFSNSGSDIDNPLKPFIDILQKKYNFNDSQIYELNVKKEIVKKGNEFISFSIGIL